MKNLKHIFASLLASALVASTAFAQAAPASSQTAPASQSSAPASSQTAQASAPKQEPPKGSAPKPFKVPPRTTYKLPNGLTVSLVPYGDVPKVAIRAVVRAGNFIEPEDKLGIADLVSSYMKEGTTKRSGTQLAQDAAQMGGQINVNATPDVTTIGGDALSEFAPKMIELVGEVATSPSFPESELARLKTDELRSLTVQKSAPGNIAREKFVELMYPGQRQGKLFPTEAMVQGYTLEDVKSFYGKNFGAARTHVYVAGKFDPAAVRAAINAAFGKWTAGPPPQNTTPKPVKQFAFAVLDRPNAPQSVINLGLAMPDPTSPDYNRLRFANTLLGGFFSSRITSNIREQKGYTYSPNSQLSARYRDVYWVQQAEVTTAVTGPALKEIYYEINRLQKEPPTPKEMDLVKNYTTGLFTIQNSTRGGILQQLQFVDLHGLGDQYLTNFVPSIMAITPEQVKETAAKYWNQNAMVLVVVGDKSKITEQLTPYEKAQAGQ